MNTLGIHKVGVVERAHFTQNPFNRIRFQPVGVIQECNIRLH